MKLCSCRGKSEKAAACGSYGQCKTCQYIYFYINVLKDQHGDKLILGQEEQAWLDNVFSKLNEADLHYVQGKYKPDLPSTYRPAKSDS